MVTKKEKKNIKGIILFPFVFLRVIISIVIGGIIIILMFIPITINWSLSKKDWKSYWNFGENMYNKLLDE